MRPPRTISPETMHHIGGVGADGRGVCFQRSGCRTSPAKLFFRGGICTNHMLCVDHIIDTATQALTQTYIKRLHYLMLYGTFTECRGKCRIGGLPNHVQQSGQVESPSGQGYQLLDEQAPAGRILPG